MKKVLLIMTLIVLMGVLSAVESAPSETVGYVKYEAVPGLNFVAMPMVDGMMWTSEVGTYMSPDDMVDTINLWNSATQSYDASINYGGGFWDPDLEVGTGSVLFFNTYAALTYYSIGAMPAANAQYNIVPGLNTIMLPLNKGDLNFTSFVGTDISPLDEIDTINIWSAAGQYWDACVNYGGGFWDPDLPVTIGMPMYVSSAASITWPAGPRATSGFTTSPETSRK
jgi:hypothetical protein